MLYAAHQIQDEVWEKVFMFLSVLDCMQQIFVEGEENKGTGI